MAKIFLPVTFLFLLGCSGIKKEKPASYRAGFKIVHAVDSSRLFKPNTATADYLHYRPLDIDIWYPADSAATDSLLLFGDILGLLEKRANYYTASDAGKGLTLQIAKSLSEGFKCSDSMKVLNFKTKSFKNAFPVADKFPLIVYMCAYNGMSFENFVLFEELAAKGFVVVSVSSIGRYPGDMSMKKEDLLEQVSDAIASLHVLKQSANIDFSKIGIIGYSWGGLAAAALAGKISNVNCLISFDGSEFHHYGEAKDEGKDFDETRYDPQFKTMALSMPYLRLESLPFTKEDKEDSVYDFSEKLSGKKFIFKVDSAQHEDFSCLPVVVRESGDCQNHQYFNTVSKLIISFLEEYLKHGTSFATDVDHEMNKTIRQK